MLADLPSEYVQRVVEVASRKGVALEIRHIPAAARGARGTAAAVAADLDQIVEGAVFVAPRPGGRFIPIVCLLPGHAQVDMSLLAAVTGEVGIRPASAREAYEHTGFLTGGIPPFGHPRNVRVVMDRELCRHQWVWAAAGTDAAVFRVAPRTLQMLSNAVVAPLAEGAPIRREAATPIRTPLQFGARSGV